MNSMKYDSGTYAAGSDEENDFRASQGKKKQI